jgi:prepilin-type N-terminal cleavage/methylation domain-containing protein/prepilin-type processing-associated H-X9-DG protein
MKTSNNIRLLATQTTELEVQRVGAFTLVELLVVIAVIAILAGLLLPALSRGKESAMSVKCLTHLRQWGVAQQVYAAENGDAIPRDGTDNSGQYAVETGNLEGPGSPRDPAAWFNVLPPYMATKSLEGAWDATTQDPSMELREGMPFPGRNAGVWHCPAAKSVPKDTFMREGVFGFFSYVMNSDLKMTSSINNGFQANIFEYPKMPRLGALLQPSSTVLFVDAAFSPTGEAYTQRPERNGIFPAVRSDRFTKRHKQSGGNIVFADGHASFFKRNQVVQSTPTREEKALPEIVWNPNREAASAR